MKKTFLLLMLLIVCILGYAVPRTATLSSPTQIGEAVARANVTKKRIFMFQIKIDGENATLTGVFFTTNGNYTASELTQFQLWYNSSNTIVSATNISTLTTELGTGTHTFSFSQDINKGKTGYFWITADIGQTLIPDHTLSVSTITTDNITFSEDVTKTGSTTAGGTQHLEYVIVTENFDESWPPSDWTIGSGVVRNNNYYSAGYSCQLNANGEFIYTRQMNNPGIVTFFAMKKGNDNYTFKIQSSPDALTWTDVATYNSSNPITTDIFSYYSVSVSTLTNVYIRFILTQKGGDIYLDDINITLRSPNTQASNVSFSDIGPSRFTVSCTAGSAAQRIMFMKEGDVATVDAANGVFYTASTNWQDPGSQIGSSGYYCIYKGTGTSVTVTGLTKSTTYTVEVMEYNYSDVANTYIYMPTPAKGVNTTQDIEPPPAVIFNVVTSYSIEFSWSTTGELTYVLFLKEDTSFYPLTPSGTYSASSDWSIKGTELGTSGFYCVYNGTGNYVKVINLQSSTRYYAVIFTFDGTNYSSGCACGGEVPTATAATNYFASIASGDWETVNTWDRENHKWIGITTWKSSRDGTHWNDATLKPTSSAAKVYIESGHIVTLTANESCNNLHFDGGWIQLGDYNLTINSYDSASGNPQFIFNGTGTPQMTTQGTNYIISVTSTSISSLPSEVNTLRINVGSGNTVNLPNDVTLTNLAFESGGLKMNSHTIKYKYKDADIYSVNATFYGMNIRLTEDINTVGSNTSLPRTWYTSGYVTDVFQATMYFPSNLTSSSKLRLWLRNNATKGWYLKGEYDVNTSGDQKYITADGLTSPDMNGIVFFDFTLSETDQTLLPVELSSFIVNVNYQNYVQILWVTQIEMELFGFRIYRGVSDDLSSALDLGIFIPATNTSEPKYYVYTDKEIDTSGTYYYWLECIDLNANSTFYGPKELIFHPGVDGNNIPVLEGINSIYPNPFNPDTTIRFGVLESSTVKAIVYNNRGQKVCEPINGYYDKGTYSYIWNATDSYGRRLSNGIYILSLHIGSKTYIRKMAILK